MSLLALLKLLTPGAQAICIDVDGDGAGPGCAMTGDCAPLISAIHPAAAEDGVDNVDNDCDGSEMIHRLFVSGMDLFFTNDWYTSGGVLGLGGSVRFTPAGVPARIWLKGALPFSKGKLTVTTRFTSITGPACYVTVQSSSFPGASYPVGSGTTVTTISGVLPGDSISQIEISCVGAGQAYLDWATVQNGPYTWAPASDVSATFETMGLPGMGRQSVVRTSDDGAYSFVGSDVGGMGWSADGYDWHAANGRLDGFSDGSDYGAWEVWSPGQDEPEDLDAYILTGDKDSADSGGLYYTSDLGAIDQTWTAAPGGLGASKHLDDCPDGDIAYKPISSGRLLLQDPGDADVLLIASSDPDTRGIWRWDRSSPTIAPVQPFDPATLPTATNVDTLTYDALPSAMAIVGDFVVVGYKVVADNGLRDYTALYRCPVAGLGSAVESIACEPVLDDLTDLAALDVRDIEVSTASGEADTTFYVADGGRTWDSSECVIGESTVYRVTFGSSGAMEVVDTDRLTSAHPSWNRTAASATAQPYFDGGACLDNNAIGSTTYGDLVSPRGILTDGSSVEGHELSTITMDPAGDYLFAFYPLNDGVREYGCARVFRTPVAEIAEEATPWLPMSGYEYGQMAFNETAGTLHAGIRRGVVEMNGAFLDAEPLAEDFAGAAIHDAVFEWSGDQPQQEFDLLAGGNFLWRLLGEDRASTSTGWDTPAPANTWLDDLDYAQWELAWAGEGAFQDASATALALCPGCLDFASLHGDLGLAAGLGDYKMARLHAESSVGRNPAARSCEVHKLNSSPADVSMWQDPSGSMLPQAWMPLVGQRSQTDTGLARGLLFTDNALADEWCWDGMADGSFTPAAYTDDIAGVADNWELYCMDTAFVSGTWWDSCDQSGVDEPWNMGDASIGVIRSLVAIGENQAVAVAAPALGMSGGVGGEGLWLLTHDATDGIIYQQVYFPPGGVDTTGDTIGDCSASELFAYTARDDLALHPDTKPSAGIVRLFVSAKSADCGLFQVSFNPATVTTAATWTEVDLSGGSCTLTSTWIQGASVTRDGEWLLAYGGGYQQTPSTVDDSRYTEPVSGGGVCAFNLTTGAAPASWTRESAASATNMGLEVRTLMPHPHLDDTWYLGGWGTFDCVNGCKEPGIYTLQRRWSFSAAAWVWGHTRLDGDDLEQRTLSDLDWGVGYNSSDSPMSRLYATASGGGYWDGEMIVE
jgi:hypothetical protein